MAERISELLAKGDLRQYLLRTGPIRLGDILAQSPDRTETLIALLRLKNERDMRLEGNRAAVVRFEGLAADFAGFSEESRPLFSVEQILDAIQGASLADLIVSLSESGFRKAAAGA